MRCLLRRHKKINRASRIYLLLRFWWVVKMNRITKNLSRLQLSLCLFIFITAGTVFCFYKISRGVLPHGAELIRIDGISVVRPAYSEQNKAEHLLDASNKKKEKQAELNRYIDSVIYAPYSIDVHNNYNSKAEDF